MLDCYLWLFHMLVILVVQEGFDMKISRYGHNPVTSLYYTVSSNPHKEGGNGMKCIACGREMLDRGTHYECSNILCDYEEGIGNKEEWIRLKPALPSIIVNNAARRFSLSC